MRWLANTAALAVLCLAVACGGGGGGSSEPPLLSVETSVVVTDVDGDSRADIITLSHVSSAHGKGEGHVVIQRQTVAGVYAEPERYIVGCYPWSMTVADVDGDGRPDLVVADPDECTEPPAGRAVYLLLQDPAQRGRFLPAQKLIGDVLVYQAAVADLNGDGAPDVALGSNLTGADRLFLLYQDSARRGHFLPVVVLPLPGSVAEIVAGDIDGDGRADLFAYLYLDPTASAPNTALAVLLQQPGGTLSAPVLLAPQRGLNAQHLSIVDVNGDGRADLLAHLTPSSTDYRPKITVVLQGASPGTWSTPADSSLAGLHGIDGTTVADLNGDGRPDVALAGTFPTGSEPLQPPPTSSRVNVIARAGPASYALAASYNLPFDAWAVGAGDVDGDGLNDLVLFGDNDVVMVMPQSPTARGTFDAPQRVR
jgi:hypothetical protein